MFFIRRSFKDNEPYKFMLKQYIDYLLSKRYYPYQREIARIRRKYGPHLGQDVDIERIMPMMETRESYIRSALDTIHAEFGDIETYLERALGIGAGERRLLRERYTA